MIKTIFSDILVVELGSRIGTAVCGSLLDQLATTVVCVEPNPDSEYFDLGKGAYRAQLAPGKMSFAPNLKNSGDTQKLLELIASADVILCSSDMDPALQSFIPSTSDTDAIICDITALGAAAENPQDKSALSSTPLSDLQIQALSGVLDTTGMTDGLPTAIQFPVLEYMAGIYAAASVVAALRVRRRGEGGQFVDISLYDGAFSAISTFLPRVLDGSNTDVRRIGNCHAMAAPWNVFQAQDGWVQICAASDQQWQRICEVIERTDLGAGSRFEKLVDRNDLRSEVDGHLQNWVSQHKVAECVQLLGDATIPCGPITPLDGYPREANLEYRDMIKSLLDPATGEQYFTPASPLRMTRTPGRTANHLSVRDGDRAQLTRLLKKRGVKKTLASAQSANLPLKGIRVIEVGHYTTAPLAARHLANLGAEVIKVEPPGGEVVRVWAPSKNGQSYFFTFTNADKKSIVLDLQKSSGVEALRQLIKESDVLIENLKPGALAKRGLSQEQMLALNPGLVCCAVSGFGVHSLYQGRPAYDSVIQGMSGMMDLIRADGIPVKSGMSAADLMGAEMSLLAILTALEERDFSGQGQAIDLSMQDIAAWATQCAWNGQETSAPTSFIRCDDGLLLVEGDGSDVREEAGSRESVAQALAQQGINSTVVHTVTEVANSAITKSRQLWFEATDKKGETWPLLASPLRLLKTPPLVQCPSGPLGEDTDSILKHLATPEYE